jgi:hypothetical protein
MPSQELHTMPKSKISPKIDGLEGRHFHTFTPDDKLHYQGHVLKKISEEFYLVEFFSWLSGEPTYQQIVPLKKMADWWFYASSEDMIYSSEEGPASRKKDKRKPTDKN